MWLEAASDTPLVNATLAIAIVTGVLALGTIATAFAALWQARSTAASVRLQRDELKAVQAQAKLTEDQLKLAREEFDVARLAARPLLEAFFDVVLPDASIVRISYAGGTEPAFRVWAWCAIASPSGRIIRQGAPLLGAMTANRAPEVVNTRPLTGNEPDQGLFAELAEPRIALLENQSWVAVTWQTADGTQGRWGYVQRVGKQERIWDESYPPSVTPRPNDRSGSATA